MSRLDVYLHGERAGSLERLEQARLRFTYAEQWIEAKGARLSLSLPVRAGPFDHESSAPFFEGLLPEGDFLKATSRAFHVSERNPFGLLSAIGGECAGAVSLGPAGGPAPGLESPPPRWLESNELARLLRDLPQRPLLAVGGGDEEDGVRISLAGAQDKLGVLFDGEEGRVGVTWGSPPSTHIAKAPIPRLADSIANEAFCMSLASASGLDVAEVQPRSAGDREYLLVRRYDRVETEDGLPHRLHQEDFCQALGFVPTQKYEAEGGPGVSNCADLLWASSAAPVRDVPAFLDALLFSFLIGNHDAHSKNYSLLLDGLDSIRLAPLYDLISTSAYPGTARKLAMKHGGENRPRYLRRRHLERLAADLRVKPRLVLQRAAQMVERVTESLDAAADSLPPAFAGRPVIADVGALVEERSERLIQIGSEAR
jgi:HipA N-terminal domain